MSESVLTFPIQDLSHVPSKELSDGELIRSIMQIRASMTKQIEAGELEGTPERLALLAQYDGWIAEWKHLV